MIQFCVFFWFSWKIVDFFGWLFLYSILFHYNANTKIDMFWCFIHIFSHSFAQFNSPQNKRWIRCFHWTIDCYTMKKRNTRVTKFPLFSDENIHKTKTNIQHHERYQPICLRKQDNTILHNEQLLNGKVTVIKNKMNATLI